MGEKLRSIPPPVEPSAWPSCVKGDIFVDVELIAKVVCDFLRRRFDCTSELFVADKLRLCSF